MKRARLFVCLAAITLAGGCRGLETAARYALVGGAACAYGASREAACEAYRRENQNRWDPTHDDPCGCDVGSR